MKKIIYGLLLTGFCFPCLAQNIGMGTLNPDASAQVEISSNARGLLIPRMDSMKVAGIKNPAKGLMVYDTARNFLLVNMGTASKPVWRNLIEQSGWSLSGNRLDIANQQFIGTINSQPLSFRYNGQPAGLIDDSTGIVSFGFGTPGYNGKQAYGNGFSGTTAVGYRALEHLDGDYTFGLFNSAFGSQALTSLTYGSGNTATGRNAMFSNLDGYYNTAIGHNSLFDLKHGSDNTAVGMSALLSTEGNANTAVGYLAMTYNTTGTANTAVGMGALSSQTFTSSYNTAVGYQAGVKFPLSSDNVFIGALADVSTSNLINVVAIGEGAICTGNSQVRLGNMQTKSIGGFVNWTNFSDGRFKKNMKEDVKGLDFIMRLRPITYTLDMDGIEASLRPGKPIAMSEGMLALKAERAATVTTGFVAQEVEKAASDLGYDFSGVDKPKNEGDFYGLRYAEFIAPMVKAMQEQQRVIEKQNRLIDELSRRLDALEKK